jgi:hypothetical protein
MPASRSASRATKPVRALRLWPLLLVGLLIGLAAVIDVLPASLIGYFLPPQVSAEDLSGTLLHGAAGKFTVNGHDAGAIEWLIHPMALWRAQLDADVHWVKVGFVIDAHTELARHAFAAREVHGGGPIENLRDLGIAAGWRGTARVNFAEISSDFSHLTSAVGKIEVADLVSSGIAAGADLGGYQLQLADGAVSPNGDVAASLKDLGGPIEVAAQIQVSPGARTGLLSGTILERPDASPALHRQLENLAQVRPKDPQGRFPVDLEFTF